MGCELNAVCRDVEISVIVPCFNVEKFVRAALESLLVQDFSNYELICVDDGSTDGTATVLQELAEANPGTIRVIHKQNEGAWLARLDGIRAASGRYIAFLDGDDTAEPHFLSSLHDAAISSNADIAICGFRRVDQDGKVISEEFCCDRNDILLSSDPGRMLEVNPAPWNKLFRRDVLMGLPSIDCCPVMFDDLSLLLLSYINGVRLISFVPKCLVNYFVRNGSQINSVKPVQLDGARSVLLAVRSAYESEGAAGRFIEALAATAFLHMGVSMTFRIISSPPDIVECELTKTRNYLDGIFPEWRKSRYLGFRYAITHGFAMLRLWVASIAFKTGLLPVLLSLYGHLIAVTGKDLKW